ncbi:MAG: glycosyltransferase family 4 protein [Marinilabiliaceae bacterium]|nr:glycosyltransferase family 4 protein [Marinilabiliaceae bacterium]
MKLAILAPVAWRTPPRHYGPWEQVASTICEGMVQKGVDVTLFATLDSQTHGRLDGIIGKAYEEDPESDGLVSTCMHISYLMEMADQFDLIHNHFDYLPLTYSRLIKTPMVTTIHGFSSSKIWPVFERYNGSTHYVSISYADRLNTLDYIGNVYNGICVDDFTFCDQPEDYLLFFGRIHPHKGAYEAIQIAKKAKRKLVISGIIQDQTYFDEKVKPLIDDEQIVFVGSSGPEKRDQLLGKALALLHPISFDEPFGLSVAESMFCGTPVIAFNRGSMPELINHNKTGFLVLNVDDAVAAVNDIRLISRSYCRSHAMANFSSQHMVEGYYDVYQKIIKD